LTQLSKLAILGIARETTPNVYLAPTAYIPFTKAEYEDQFVQIKDTSYRGNDSELQGSYQGPSEADWSIDLDAYPDIAGYFLRGIIGPDTVTAGAATTLSAAAAAGATSITVTSATGIAENDVLQLGSGATLEYVTVTAISTDVLTVTGTSITGELLYAHTSGDAVQGQSTHLFKQSIVPSDRATFSLTIFDTLTTNQYTGLALSDVDIKIDPKGAITLSTKGKSYQGVTSTSMTPSFTAYEPMLGWEWVMANSYLPSGSAQTRGLTMDLKTSRKLDVIHSSNGVQQPREIFQGALSVEGTMKTIFESEQDLQQFITNSQGVISNVITQPVAKGGAVLTLTTSKSAVHKAKRSFQNYVEVDSSLSGVYNVTDGGILQATLVNFQSSQY
jgi:hypothetical protein